MNIKTSALTGRALDWAVARAVGMDIYMVNHYDDEYAWIGNGRVREAAFKKPVITVGMCNDVHVEFEGESKKYSPSTDWSICGQLIDEYGIQFIWVSDATIEATSYLLNGAEFGRSHLKAACRLIVFDKLGDEVEIPDELVEAE
ncbi:phage protein NinX family protein [Xenorhabdus griffiniae]|uniref:phage protein NinX family protein n=1 Tax=Xenorhabdus griffiniae TaxID=351672 RepID=UPI0030D14C0E